MTTFVADGKLCFYSDDRNEWRRWLEENFETAKEITVAFPAKGSERPGMTYNDAVEAQIEEVKAQKKYHSFAELLETNDIWEVHN